MSTEKEPDYAGIAKRMAEQVYPRKMWPEGTLDEVRRQRKGYASCMEARLRSDWETIRLLREARSFVRRDGENDRGLSHRIDAQLSKLLEPFTP